MESLVYKLHSAKNLKKEYHVCDPNNLQAHEVLAETKYSVISRGTEIAAWLGSPPLQQTTAVYPRLMGYCNLAKVIGVGRSVCQVSVGDHILTHQSHRSSFKCSERDVLLRIESKDELLLKKLTATYLYHLGYSALMKAKYVPGCQVAVLGMGVLGIIVSSLTRAFGGDPYCYTNQNTDVFLERFKFKHIYRKADKDKSVSFTYLDLDGFDIVVNTANAWADHLLAMKLARQGGSIVYLGFPGRGLDLPSYNVLDSHYFYSKQLNLMHCGYIENITVSPNEKRFTLKRNMGYLASLIAANVIDPFDIITDERSCNELAVVYEMLAKNQPGQFTCLMEW